MSRSFGVLREPLTSEVQALESFLDLQSKQEARQHAGLF